LKTYPKLPEPVVRKAIGMARANGYEVTRIIDGKIFVKKIEGFNNIKKG